MVHHCPGSASPGDPGGSSAHLEAASEPGESILHGEHMAWLLGNTPMEKGPGRWRDSRHHSPMKTGLGCTGGDAPSLSQADLFFIHLQQSSVGVTEHLMGFSVGTAWFPPPHLTLRAPSAALAEPRPCCMNHSCFSVKRFLVLTPQLLLVVLCLLLRAYRTSSQPNHPPQASPSSTGSDL